MRARPTLPPTPPPPPRGLRRFVASREFPVPAETLLAWHARPGALERLLPPWEAVEVESQVGGIEDGCVVLRLRGPVGSLRWVARHRDFVAGREFCDEQVRGPFAHWVHRHVVVPVGPGSSRLEDRVAYALPLGRLGAALGGKAVLRRLRRTFAFRHRRTAEDLARHAPHRDRPRLRVAISGASGFVGRALSAFLTTGGHAVVPLVRGGDGPGIRWDPAEGRIDARALEGFDAVVHLAGAGIAQRRWSASRKRLLHASRVEGTRCLATALASLAHPPSVLVAASAAGIYGDRGEEELPDGAAPGTGFLADLGRAWEDAATPAVRAGVRTVHLRLGVVLGARGGALAKMLPAYRAGLGGPLGGGGAWMPWIALDDVLGVVLHALFEPTWAGAWNVVAPQAVRQRDVARALGRALSRPAVLPLPRLAARLAFGEVAPAVLLASQRVRPTRLLDAGFPFLRPDLDAALGFELGRLAPDGTTIFEA